MSAARPRVCCVNHTCLPWCVQLEFAESAQAQAEQATAAVRSQLEAAQAEVAGSRQAVEDKESRLAHLEGEACVGWAR